ncbi:alpha/beta fold hydrolase [Leifsonia sp. NPDC058292]|uniref:alpha/beta fold hydrolase n=1 Tax=Leifsonia sp. NPDC058292 TaxID=3346428 RepID=UPI0036DCB102
MTIAGDVRTADGRSVRYYDSGEAPGVRATVFWHHGTPQTGRLLEPLAAAAGARGIRVVSCARAGYEGTSPIGDRNVSDAAADVVRVADALGIARFGSIGASGGGPHALACAALAPERVSAVVTFAGVAPFADEPGWFEGMVADGGLRSARNGRSGRAAYAETAEFDPNSFTPADFELLAGAWGVLGEDAQRSAAQGADGEIDDDVALTKPWGFDLGDVVAPVLLVQGGEDRVIPASHADRLLAGLPRAELWFRPRDGHVSVLGALPVALDWFVEAVSR